MKFFNEGEPIKIRIGTRDKCDWKTIKTNEVIELTKRIGKTLGLTKLKTTEGQMGNQVIQTKQIENYTPDNLFLKELQAINGIGKKTAEDIVTWGTKKKLIEQIKLGESLPFRNDIESLLRKRFLL